MGGRQGRREKSQKPTPSPCIAERSQTIRTIILLQPLQKVNILLKLYHRHIRALSRPGNCQ